MVGIFLVWGECFGFVWFSFLLYQNIIYTKNIDLTLSPALTQHYLCLKWSEELVDIIKSFSRDKFPLCLGLFHSPNMRGLGKAPFL